MRKKILVVDDDASIRLLMKHVLSEHFDVHLEANGADAISWLHEGNMPDLIVSDVLMPEMGGNEFISYLKTSLFFRNIPVVVLSSLNKSTDRISFYELGADEFIIKPFDPVELQYRVKYLLRERKAV